MAIAEVATDILLTRLRWPVPRVRLEAARALASLIRGGNQDAITALVKWIGSRTFESEVIIGLCIIDAFDLSSFFSFEKLRDAVRVPSHLSDALLQENFGRDDGLWPFRYGFAPPSSAPLAERIKSQFSAMNGVPRMFHSHLQMIERRSNMPLLRRWQHEWEWLQFRSPRHQGQPSYFFQGDREATGQFDFADRETYVSSYLRTLAFAANNWGLPHDAATYLARSAITLNRGLADVIPIERPEWTDGVVLDDQSATQAAKQLWEAAQDQENNLALASLRVAELTETAFVRFQFDAAYGPADADLTVGPQEQRGALLSGTSYAGTLKSHNENLDQTRMTKLCGMVMPADVGRHLVDIVPRLLMPSPNFVSSPLMLQCSANEVTLSQGQRKIARWQHWYADWQPTEPKALGSLLGYRTLMDAPFLEENCRSTGLKHGVWCSVKWGTRQYAYSEFTVGREAFWLDQPNNA